MLELNFMLELHIYQDYTETKINEDKSYFYFNI